MKPKRKNRIYQIKDYLTRHYDSIGTIAALKTMCKFGYSIKEVLDAYRELQNEGVY